jgi:hypothetical protein
MRIGFRVEGRYFQPAEAAEGDAAHLGNVRACDESGAIVRDRRSALRSGTGTASRVTPGIQPIKTAL